jgi:hypothetical protein
MHNDMTIIDSTGNKITLPFNEMKIYIDKLVEKFISLNGENKNIYEKFKEDYKTFNPNLDFLLSNMGYLLELPFNEDILLTGLEDNLIDLNTFRKKYQYIYPRVTEKNLNIHKLGVDNVESGMIDPNGILYSIDKKDITHLQVCELLTLHMIMNNEEIYQKYLENKHKYNDPIAFLVNELGFVRVVVYPNKSGIILYNEDIASGYIKGMINSVKDFYPEIQDVVLKKEGEEICK